jgi:hypothetical protein
MAGNVSRNQMIRNVVRLSGRLLNQSNSGSPELVVSDLLVGFRERKPLRRGEEAGDMVAGLVEDRRWSGRSFEEEGDWDLLN